MIITIYIYTYIFVYLHTHVYIYIYAHVYIYIYKPLFIHDTFSVNFSLNSLQDAKLICRQHIYICVSVDDEFQFALSLADPSKELETYFVISNFLAKLKLIIQLQQFLQGIKKVYITVHNCTLLYITVHYCTLLYITVRYCTLLYITVHYCT
jgi:hypothetical protein